VSRSAGVRGLVRPHQRGLAPVGLERGLVRPHQRGLAPLGLERAQDRRRVDVTLGEGLDHGGRDIGGGRP